LSGEMHRRLTCESGCGMVREQMPDRASQKLVGGGQWGTGRAAGRGERQYRIVWS